MELCDRITKCFQQHFDLLNISYDRCIRTTDNDHNRAVCSFWNRLVDSDMIYKSSYEGWYCTSDEEFLSADDVEEKLVNGETEMVSKQSGREVEWVKEENYKLRLSKLQPRLEKWLDSNPNFVYPRSHHTEVVKMVKGGLHDISVSRCSKRVRWAIPVPNDSSQTIYVWFDALINYLTASGYPDGPSLDCWPPDIQILGKDILRFHAIIWPSLLLAAGLELPRQLIVHSHFTVDKVKMSKSLGNVIHPLAVVAELGLDPFRYYLLYSSRVSEDSDFNVEVARDRVNANLSDSLGNLLMRSSSQAINSSNCVPHLFATGTVSSTTTATERAALFDKLFDKEERAIIGRMNSLATSVDQFFSRCEFGLGLDEVAKLCSVLNRYFTRSAPWTLVKEKNPPANCNLSPEQREMRLRLILNLVLEGIRICAVLLQPIIPQSASQILDKLSVPVESRKFRDARYQGLDRYHDISMQSETRRMFPKLEKARAEKA